MSAIFDRVVAIGGVGPAVVDGGVPAVLSVIAVAVGGAGGAVKMVVRAPAHPVRPINGLMELLWHATTLLDTSVYWNGNAPPGPMTPCTSAGWSSGRKPVSPSPSESTTHGQYGALVVVTSAPDG